MNAAASRCWGASLACALAVASGAHAARGMEPADAERFNGTWRMDQDSRGGEMMLWALDARTLRVEFQGYVMMETARGSRPNMGIATGTGSVEGGKASFTPIGTAGECVITLHLRDAVWMKVEERGSCGFGEGVSSRGRYKRVSRTLPAFHASASFRVRNGRASSC